MAVVQPRPLPPNFKTSVDWMKVNIGMAQDCFGPADDMAVAIDPSFISKAGRLTYGIGRFWSGWHNV